MAWAVQSYVVSKRVAGSREEAARLAKKKGARIYTSRETETTYRFRQRPPGDFVQGSFRMQKLGGGVTQVLGRLR